MDVAQDTNRDWAGLVTMSLDECYQRLGREPVGRLGFIDQGGPVILPVNFTLDGRSIVFRTGEGSKLATAVMEGPVCLEVDGWDGFEHDGWSVLVKGIATEVDDADSVEHFESLPVRPWAQPELRCHWIRLRPDEVTGRQIAPEPIG